MVVLIGGEGKRRGEHEKYGNKEGTSKKGEGGKRRNQESRGKEVMEGSGLRLKWVISSLEFDPESS